EVSMGPVGSPLVTYPLGSLWSRPLDDTNVIMRTGFSAVGQQMFPLDSYASGYSSYSTLPGYPYLPTYSSWGSWSGYAPVWSWYSAYRAEYVPTPLTLYQTANISSYAPPARWGSSTLRYAPAPRDPNTALITVRLPASNATLFLDGKKQEGPTGTQRVLT